MININDSNNEDETRGRHEGVHNCRSCWEKKGKLPINCYKTIDVDVTNFVVEPMSGIISRLTLNIQARTKQIVVFSSNTDIVPGSWTAVWEGEIGGQIVKYIVM